MALKLYELAGADADLRFSPHCWKARMALAHKGLTADCTPWRYFDKPLTTALSGQDMVPVLVDGDAVVSDSWRIAQHLEDRYPDRPSLFGNEQGRSLARFINGWADNTLSPPLRMLLVQDIFRLVHDDDKAYFRASREQRMGCRLEEIGTDAEPHLAGFRAALAPLRTLLGDQPFLGGDTPLYADYCAFGVFMWARTIRPLELLEAADPVFAWRDRMLDTFGGMPRNARAVGA
ncbi:glutathione S-transferase family protein [Xanthobacteraceae bacterium A53D]